MATAIQIDARAFTGVLETDLDTIEAGVSLDMLDSFLDISGIAHSEIYQVVIPARTLKHRRSLRQRLSRDESDKFVRLARIYEQAVHVFGDTQKALSWLRTPKDRFKTRTPLEILSTDIGGRMVEEMLGQIDEGYFA